MEVKIYCAVLAGGIGARMGAGEPKQFMLLEEKSVLARAVGKFVGIEGIERVFVTSPPEYLERTALELEREYPGAVTVLAGGADRNGSIEKVIAAIRESDRSPEAMLITHDGARPFVPRSVVERCVELCREQKGSAVVIPSNDTIAECDDGVFAAIPPRSRMYICQTPQSFPIAWFEHDYAALSPQERAVQTDACGMFLRSGRTVEMVEGARCNIKLTTRSDLLLAGLLARAEDKGDEIQ